MAGINHQLSVLGDSLESIFSSINLSLQFLMQLKSASNARHITHHLLLVYLCLDLVRPRLQAPYLLHTHSHSFAKRILFNRLIFHGHRR